MAKVTIVSTTGFPHSAVFIDYKDIKYQDTWISFEPGNVLVNGQIVEWSFGIENSITFDLVDTRAYGAAVEIRKQYTENSFYFLGVRDCVSFAADFCRYCGLLAPTANFTPYGLVLFLSYYNNYETLK